MNKSHTDTIVARATAPGRGGIAIVRVSGPRVIHIAEQLLGKLPKPRYASFHIFKDEQDNPIDEGIALFFPNPNSFTGEDVLELQGHGGPAVVDCLIKRILSLGARLARPGEFSERAFLNDKIDLAQAEAIADLIDATSEQAARASLRSLQGEFSKKIHELVEMLIRLRMYVEAAIDFVEEEIDFLADQQITNDLNTIIQKLEQIRSSATQGSLLRDGITVVIAGQPNVGKSSLLNQLSGRDIAIVTDIPGTTRDVLREHINLDGMPIHFIDTAGLRVSDDPVEQEGIRRARDEISRADLILCVVDARDQQHLESTSLRALRSLQGVAIQSDMSESIAPLDCHVAKSAPRNDTANDIDVQRDAESLPNIPIKAPIVIIQNKIDLTSETPTVKVQDGRTIITLSAKTGIGLDLLKNHIQSQVGFQANSEGIFSARRRHLDAIERAMNFLLKGQQQLGVKAGELLAEDLRQAQYALNEITGEFTSDDLLGRIFSSFCIGK